MAGGKKNKDRKKNKDGPKALVRNRKARFDYAIEDTFEAGMVLTGSEVKSLRDGHGVLVDAFVQERSGEMWLMGAKISPYPFANQQNHDPTRDRKLLLHRAEIDRLSIKVRDKGFSLIPLAIYLKKGRLKVEIALAQGKREYEKRQSQREKDAKREIDASMAARRR